MRLKLVWNYAVASFRFKLAANAVRARAIEIYIEEILTELKGK